MEKLKNNCYLFIAIIILIIANITLISKVDIFNKEGKRFTYQDWLVLYKICQKNWGSKDKIIKEIYQWNNTDFKKFLTK